MQKVETIKISIMSVRVCVCVCVYFAADYAALKISRIRVRLF